MFAVRFVPEVLGDLEPMQSLLAAGIPLAIGTDGIGAAQSPFVNLLLATVHPTHPSEALTLTQAVAAFTRGAAYAEFEESRKGTLAPGKLADLAVLSQTSSTSPRPISRRPERAHHRGRRVVGCRRAGSPAVAPRQPSPI